LVLFKDSLKATTLGIMASRQRGQSMRFCIYKKTIHTTVQASFVIKHGSIVKRDTLVNGSIVKRDTLVNGSILKTDTLVNGSIVKRDTFVKTINNHEATRSKRLRNRKKVPNKTTAQRTLFFSPMG
jgi:hypothetical protein